MQTYTHLHNKRRLKIQFCLIVKLHKDKREICSMGFKVIVTLVSNSWSSHTKKNGFTTAEGNDKLHVTSIAQ